MPAGWFRGRYAAAAPADLEPGAGHVAGRGWLVAPPRLARRDPAGDLERRRDQVDRTRALTRRQLEGLFARRDLPLRERTVWRLLDETAARANELLTLEVEDLDLANRRPSISELCHRSSRQNALVVGRVGVVL